MLFLFLIHLFVHSFVSFFLPLTSRTPLLVLPFLQYKNRVGGDWNRARWLEENDMPGEWNRKDFEEEFHLPRGVFNRLAVELLPYFQTRSEALLHKPKTRRYFSPEERMLIAIR